MNRLLKFCHDFFVFWVLRAVKGFMIEKKTDLFKIERSVSSGTQKTTNQST